MTFTDVQGQCSELPLLNGKHYYLYNGVPDILLQREVEVAIVTSTEIEQLEEKSQVDTVVIENKKQVPVMTQIQNHFMPIMLGQVQHCIFYLLRRP